MYTWSFKVLHYYTADSDIFISTLSAYYILHGHVNFLKKKKKKKSLKCYIVILKLWGGGGGGGGGEETKIHTKTIQQMCLSSP